MHPAMASFTSILASPMPMVLTDPKLADHPIICANRAFVELTGYPENEIVGRNCRFLQGPGTDPSAVRELRLAIAERRPALVQLLNYRRNGTAFMNAVLLGPVYGSDGELAYFFANQLEVPGAPAPSDEELAARERLEQLSGRERDVLRLLGQGMMSKQVAVELHISPRTVETYRANLMRKLGTRSLPEAMRIDFAANAGSIAWSAAAKA
jgi:PAS domain S-box-containing protein